MQSKIKLFIILLLLLVIVTIYLVTNKKPKISITNIIQESLKRAPKRSIVVNPSYNNNVEMHDIKRQQFLYYKNLIDTRTNTIKSSPNFLQNKTKKIKLLNDIINTHMSKHKANLKSTILKDIPPDVPAICRQNADFAKYYNIIIASRSTLKALLPVLATTTLTVNIEDGLDEAWFPIEIIYQFNKELAKELLESIVGLLLEILAPILTSLIVELIGCTDDGCNFVNDVIASITNIGIWVVQFLLDPFTSAVELTADLIMYIGCLASPSLRNSGCEWNTISEGSIQDIVNMFNIDSKNLCIASFDHQTCLPQYIDLSPCKQGDLKSSTKCLAQRNSDSCTNACNFYDNRNACGYCNNDTTCVCNSIGDSPPVVSNPPTNSGATVYGYKCSINKTCDPITDITDDMIKNGLYFEHNATCAGMCDLTGETVQLIGGGKTSKPMNFCDLVKLPNSCADIDHNINFDGVKGFFGQCQWQGLTNISPGMNITPYGLSGFWENQSKNCTPIVRGDDNVWIQANLSNYYGAPVPSVGTTQGISFTESGGGACAGKFSTTAMNPNACG